RRRACAPAARRRARRRAGERGRASAAPFCVDWPAMSTLERRCVLVTGASGNLGAAVVERLRRSGATVVALTRKQADLSVEAQVAQTPLELFEKMIDINLRSCFLCCRAALRRMRGEGRIVNVAALNAATLSGVRGSAAYAASKAGVVALTKAIAEEGGGVRANCIAPGTMRTPANGNLPGQVPLEAVA